MSPLLGLKHLVYFETLAQCEEGTEAWNSTTAGLVILRMLDTWVDLGKYSLRENKRGIANMRKAVDAIPEGNPTRKILHGLMDSIEKAKHPDMTGIIPRLMAYGRALDYQSRWRLSSDVYITVLGYTTQTSEPGIRIDAYLQLGYCHRMMAEWEAAAQAYAEAGQIASAHGDVERVLRTRIADAKLAIDRGNLPHAEALLDDTILQAHESERLSEVRALALHERAAVAYMRGQFEESIKFGYNALDGMQNLTARDRVLSDIAISFAELGVLSAARDALIIVAATAQELYLKWAAEINLLEIASKLREEPAFEMYRRELADTELPASLKANYHLHVGRGYQHFGKVDLARTELQLALTVATEFKFNQLAFEAEKSLRDLDSHVAVEEPTVYEPAGDVADIAAALRDLREQVSVR